jgi:hypothetical protein
MAKAKENTATQLIEIAPPTLNVAQFTVRCPIIVVHRMSSKLKQQQRQKREEGSAASNKRTREPRHAEDLFNEARYVSPEGWDEFHAGGLRAALVSACRLCGFKMVMAKLSLFVMADGWDATEPQVPLIRIYGEPTLQEDLARTQTGDPYVPVRAAYHNCILKPRIRYDARQFSLTSITNLLATAGLQVGIGEGRPDSPKSCGMGWGLFELMNEEESGE